MAVIGEMVSREQKLASLKTEAQALAQEIESKDKHLIGQVLHVASVAFQFGQLGEIWEGFVSMDTMKEIGAEAGKGMYPTLIMHALGKEFLKQIQINEDEGIFSVESIKRIAAISSMIGDMSIKRTIL